MMPPRAEAWARLSEPWDLVIVGGGITGAGLLFEAARLGFRALLLEGRDFAWGTSSRSGKMVHGGLRYLRQGQFRTTWHSVREREALLRLWPGLVRPLGFLMPLYRAEPPGRPAAALGLWLYDLFAGHPTHRYLDPERLLEQAPHLRREGLQGGYAYPEALTDDARLVLALIQEALRLGAGALNYARVEGLRQTRAGHVEGVMVRDVLTGREAEVGARVVINATGPWADGLRGQLGRPPRLRLLRGSHLIFPGWRLPLAQGLIMIHPVDGRPLYALPWEGVTLVGTTDVDHDQDLEEEPAAAPAEVDYLLTALRRAFPFLDLTEADLQATFAGVRAVIGTGRQPPSREPRDHAVWDEGILTVTGGKLTTFRVMARDALGRIRRRLPAPRPPARPALAPPEIRRDLDPRLLRRLWSRYGPMADTVLQAAPAEDLAFIPGTPVLWAEVRWAAGHEAVVHLDDLMLRRTRLGVLLPQGGIPWLRRHGDRLQSMLGWDEARWLTELERYQEIWRRAWQPPAPGGPQTPAPRARTRADLMRGLG